MEESYVGVNLRRLRHARALTQATMAARAGISRAAYCNIEAGRAEPRVATLQALAAALGAPIAEVVAPARALTAVRFRSHSRLRAREHILTHAARWLADFNALEELVGDIPDNRLPDVSVSGLASCDAAAQAADQVRRAFGLGASEAVRDLCGLLEAHGIKVGAFPVASQGFFGLSVAPSDGGPAIVVNTWDRISVERWIFTAAHELGHLVLHLADYHVAQTEELDEHEDHADAFASAFLMPDGVFWSEWDETYGLPFIERVLKVKRIFRVSYQTVLYRLAQTKACTGNVWRRFQLEYQARYPGRLRRADEPQALPEGAFRASAQEPAAAKEPERLSRFDFPGDRLSRLVRRAVEQGQISLGRGAEILGHSMQEMRELSASWAG